MFRRRLEKTLGAAPAWLLPILMLLTIPYAGLTALHRGLYAAGVLRSRRLPLPAISVGNLTVGGGGKTPLVMWLAGALVAEGMKPAVLSRGYGREGRGVGVVTEDGPWREFGDEPVMMAKKLGTVPVAVAADRYAAALELLRHHDLDLFILDDGFQHRALYRDLDVVAVDSRRRFGSGRLLPAGILREPVKRLREADVVVVTKAESVDREFEQYLTGFSSAPVLWAGYRSQGLFLFNSPAGGDVENNPSGPFTAFCGIADPEGFRNTLDVLGLEVREMVVFPDHHPFTAADIEVISETAIKSGSRCLITTEKDTVRLPANCFRLPCYYPPMEPVFLEDPAPLVQRVAELVRTGGKP